MFLTLGLKSIVALLAEMMLVVFGILFWICSGRVRTILLTNG